MMRKARRWYFKHSKGADLGNVLRFLIWQPDRSNRDGPQAILCDASAWWWPLTKRPLLAGEYEKADPKPGSVRRSGRLSPAGRASGERRFSQLLAILRGSGLSAVNAL